MSRLDSFIRRLQAQRAVIESAAAMIADISGPVFEIGLGNGRTYDHLRQLLPRRQIFAFDRVLAAHPDCVPDSDHLVLGDFRDTLPKALERIHQRAAFAHCDIGSGDVAGTRDLANWLGPALSPLMAATAIVCADQPLVSRDLTPVALPVGVEQGRYFIYRAAGPA